MVKPYLAIPSRDGRLDCRHLTVFVHTACAYPGIAFDSQALSLLVLNFNTLYANALNAREQGFTHFVLLHDDIVPMQTDWLQRMLAEMETHQLDVLSAVVVIKGTDRISCGTYDGKESFGMTFKDFGADRTWVNNDDPILLVNSGCLVVDIRKPWVDDFCFTSADHIVKDADGKYRAIAESEDYRMSVWLAKRGIRYGATSKVPVYHIGRCDYQAA